MKKTFLIAGLIFILYLLFYSCYSIKRYRAVPLKKEIRARTELEKGDLLYEDGLAILYFDREVTLKMLKNRLKNNYDRKCDKNRLIECIENIEKGNSLIFEPLKGPLETVEFSYYFEKEFKCRILELLLLNSKFSIFNKSTKVYEEYLIYKRTRGVWGCCSNYFEFPNGDQFITTAIFTDFIIIEDCDE